MTTQSQISYILTEAVSKYLTMLSSEQQRETQQDLNRFVRWLGGTQVLSKISPHEVATFTDSLGNSSNPVKRLKPVKDFLAWAKKEGLTTTNLGVNLRPAKSKNQFVAKSRKAEEEERALLTAEGYQQLRDELETAKAERPRIAESLRLAREDKDFRENAPLDAARDHQAHVETRIRELENLLKRAEVVTTEDTSNVLRVHLGSTVVVLDIALKEEMAYTLVHPHEANIAHGKMSVVSPMGKAMLERTAGEDIHVEAPVGILHYRIQRIEPGH